MKHAFDEAARNGSSSECASQQSESVRRVEALLVSEKGCEKTDESVAIEVHADFVVNDIWWASTALTPIDLTDCAYGALFSAGSIVTPEEVVALEVAHHDKGVAVKVRLNEEATARHMRAMEQGTQSSNPPCVAMGETDAGPLKPEAIWRMSRSLLSKQGMHRATGATHAAVFADREGQPLIMREDVGRHNAVDKLIGALLRAGVDTGEGFVYLSSRCALELVTKCAHAGVRVVATVSAPTTAVLDFAAEHDVTLCAFARDGRFTIYAHPERIAL